MRINPEMLIKIAKDHVARRERKEKDLIAVYLTGSVTEGEPLLGGTTDIDMVLCTRRACRQARGHSRDL